LRILITNVCLDGYAGTEVVVRDLAIELSRHGHDPVVYSPKLGPVADEIRNAGITVTDRLDSLTSVPDLIHGHHHQAMEALLHFPSVPAVYVCHGAKGYDEAPFYFPRILRYVAVDNRCKKRIASVPEIPPARIEVIWNPVDLARFQPRGPLPPTARRALVFSNNAGLSTHLPQVRKACRQAGLELDVIGARSGNAVPNPETLLPGYDIVFAKARCALEAMAAGNAVVLCDSMGLGPMVSTANFDQLRPMNFGAGVLVDPLRPELIRRAMERYDPNDAAAVSQRVRKEAGLMETTRRWVDLYTDVIEEFRHSERDVSQEFQALSVYFKDWSYGRRIDWERQQVRRVGSVFRRVPLVGGTLHRMARGVLVWATHRVQS
jgi:Glycosyltransferase Family 4